jgi:hypothetical protein
VKNGGVKVELLGRNAAVPAVEVWPETAGTAVFLLALPGPTHQEKSRKP